MRNILLVVFFCLSVLTLRIYADGGEKMRLTSPAFKDNEFIPDKWTCKGEDINPELVIEDMPQNTKSLALIVDDPDAPRGTWVHWLVYDMALIKSIKENSVPGKQGINDAGTKNYHGPCPPQGVHRYFFKIYALDCQLNLKEGIDKPCLEKAMQNHILDKAELIGLYTKGN